MSSDVSAESNEAAAFSDAVNGFNYVEMSQIYEDEDENPYLLMGSYNSKNPADWSWKIYDQYTRNSDALDDLENLFVVPEEDISIVVQAVDEIQLSAKYNAVNVMKTDGDKDALDENWWLLRDGRGLKDVYISREFVIMMVKEIQWRIYLRNYKDTLSKLRLITGTVDNYSEEILDNSDFTPHRIIHDRGKLL